MWAEVRYTLGCGLLHSLLDLPGWEEYVTFEGYFSTGTLIMNHYVKFLQPVVKHFSELQINGDILCYSTAMDLFDQMKVGRGRCSSSSIKPGVESAFGFSA